MLWLQPRAARARQCQSCGSEFWFCSVLPLCAEIPPCRQAARIAAGNLEAWGTSVPRGRHTPAPTPQCAAAWMVVHPAGSWGAIVTSVFPRTWDRRFVFWVFWQARRCCVSAEMMTNSKNIWVRSLLSARKAPWASIVPRSASSWLMRCWDGGETARWWTFLITGVIRSRAAWLNFLTVCSEERDVEEKLDGGY